MNTVMQLKDAVVATFRRLGPYVLLEVLLPGGTLFAMTLFVYRNPDVARSWFAKGRKAVKLEGATARQAFRRRMARMPALTTGLEAALRALG